MSQFSKLVFARSFDDSDVDAARDRGYLSHVLVETLDGNLFAVTFYDPVRLVQDVAENASQGQPVVADPGMIVVPEITREAMELAARTLCDQGFFSHLRPVDRETLAAADPYEWPPPRQA